MEFFRTDPLSVCALPGRGSLQLGLQPPSTLCLVPQGVEQLADRHLLVVQPGCCHAQVGASTALGATHLVQAVKASVLRRHHTSARYIV